MLIDQISVFVENKTGRLAELMEVLNKNEIDIRAMTIADTADFGILRLIVDKPNEAVSHLKAEGLTVSLTDVIAVGIPDKPGGIAKTLSAIAATDVGVEYVYECVARNADHAYFVMRVADNEKAVAALKAHGCDIIDGDRL